MAHLNESSSLGELLAEQVAYYEADAQSFEAEDAAYTAETRHRLVDELRPRGEIVELACGTGHWTLELIRYADSITAVDASPTALRINRARVRDDRVRYVAADLFAWKPDRLYDTVFFGFWLSHVPPARFDAFWSMVGSCVGTTGTVMFVDEDDRSTLDTVESRFVREGTPCVRRVRQDGSEYEIVKVFWSVQELHNRLRDLGWEMNVRPIHDMFMVGSGRRTG
jgi:demethylmenaquinone methyltransferase/2-methoxy-6-polyprenyl-1,4-benzoquinol methylase